MNTEAKPAEPDKYDRAVAYLTDHPEQIFDAWNNPKWHQHGCLFAVASRNGATPLDCGCLTQIRKNPFVFYAFGRDGVNEVVTAAIRSDERIPAVNGDAIGPAHLPVFAEWQRRLDRELAVTP